MEQYKNCDSKSFIPELEEDNSQEIQENPSNQQNSIVESKKQSSNIQGNNSTKPICVVKPFRVEEKPKTPPQPPQQSTSSWLFDNGWKIAAGVAAATLAIGAAVSLAKSDKKNNEEDDDD